MVDTSRINSRFIFEAFGAHEPEEDLISKEDSMFCSHKRGGSMAGPFSSNYSAFQLKNNQTHQEISTLDNYTNTNEKQKVMSSTGFNVDKNEVFSDGVIQQEDAGSHASDDIVVEGSKKPGTAYKQSKLAYNAQFLASDCLECSQIMTQPQINLKRKEKRIDRLIDLIKRN